MRVGSVETQKVDARIIAATNVDLKKMVAEGRFRDDLYYRLCVITISIPPLRERREDIPLLAEHFMRLYATENSKPIAGLDPEAYRALLDHDWPGNVRELENALERAVVLCPPEAGSASTCCRRPCSSPSAASCPIRLPGERRHLQAPRRGLREAPDPDRPAAHRRRPEARRGAAEDQAHDAPRDHQETRDPGLVGRLARRQPPHHHQRPVVRERLALRVGLERLRRAPTRCRWSACGPACRETP